ncbi:uncharacterized protein LOC111064148 isoform X2 [Nilaparvata lugens]|nr:uncharacterized protein LOC111064148 isoform X2 [Nilaparvata lugens]XP_039277297.1 uncharacterized protein LOC111064148 isoform X2 [Nilaparvata lugens]XP_039277298.1 uncharacterized protein LOC111064148 isoform X2 [Nilaparvata lugens]XP_039277299.1 uncharacterized protein LOC111064148 isoform X2 [Nilaparvata lugens]
MAMDTNIICRLCHKSSGVAFFDLFASPESELYTPNAREHIGQIDLYLSIKINQSDGFSNFICHMCLFNLSLCNKLSMSYSSTCMEANDNYCCCICRRTDKLLQVTRLTKKIMKRVKNCLTYNGDCPLLNEAYGTEHICYDCVYKLDEVCKFYTNIEKCELPTTIKTEIIVKEEPIEEEEERKEETPNMENYVTSMLGEPSKSSELCEHHKAGRADASCKHCIDYAKSVTVEVTDLRYFKKM